MVSETDRKNLKVNCPQCRESFYYYQSPFRPFCSQRCRMVDLGHWLNESFKIPVESIDEEIDDENKSD